MGILRARETRRLAQARDIDAAFNAEYASQRARAVGKIKNQSVLGALALGADNPTRARVAAVERLKGSGMLMSIAQDYSENSEVRAAAIRRMGGRITVRGRVLASLAGDTRNPTNVRLAALEGIRDPGFLRGVSERESDPLIKGAAAARLDFLRELNDIARTQALYL
ncbi:MAG: hypothetical protein KGH72_03390 [Candidatus Micrarchaeota archaeon]|nr:hypothetical protein [Candidatus Micrarchaeota archaeon]